MSRKTFYLHLKECEFRFNNRGEDLKAVYTAQTEEDAQLALTEFDNIWGKKYPRDR